MNKPPKKNHSTPLKSFNIKERSLSSIQLKNYYVSDLRDEKNKAFQTLRSNVKIQQETDSQRKRDQITVLKKKLDTAINLAINQKMLASSKRQRAFIDQKTKAWYQRKLQELEAVILRDRDVLKDLQILKEQIQTRTQCVQAQLRQERAQSALLLGKIKELEGLSSEIPYLRMLVKDQQPLKQRIKLLEDETRMQRNRIKDTSSRIKKFQKQKEQLVEQLRMQRPIQDELRQKIAYWERVNLDLSRKMQDYDRRQNQYIRTANINKKQIKRLTQQKQQLQTNLSDISQQLKQTSSQCESLNVQLNQRISTIQVLQVELEGQRQKIIKLDQQIATTKQFYKNQQAQNAELKKRNKCLLEHQMQYQRTIAHFQKVNDEINLTIISRIQQITKLHLIIQSLEGHTSKIQQKFQKFEVLFQDRTEKGDNQIREFYYVHIRQNAKLKIMNRELKTQMQQKVLQFGQERDSWARKAHIRSTETPNDEDMFINLYHEKNQELILLQGSNDQLLKLKKQLQHRIGELESQLQQEKKQAVTLKLKASQVFRAKKQVQESRKTINRYQLMIEEQNQSIKDYESQLVVLRERMTFFNQKNFQLDLDNRNSAVKIKELEDMMGQINADVLIQRKNRNDKNAHLIDDSLDKLQNGIKSLSFFFTCCFCGDVPANPVTLSPCGHTYCQKPRCKQAYVQFCHQCDTGMPIQNYFNNKYMKQAMGKYKFFKIVIDEVTDNVKALIKSA